MNKRAMAFFLAGVMSLAAADISPEQQAELLTNRQFRPTEVALTKSVKIDVLSEGKKTGEITVPAGRVVQLQEIKDQNLRILVGSSETTVLLSHTDYLDRSLALKKDWDKKSLAEKRAKLIAESPRPATGTTATPVIPSAPPQNNPEPVAARADATATEKTEKPELIRLDPQKKKLIRFLTSQPFKCMENGQMAATSTFRVDGTYILNNGYVGKWKLDKTGELITYCNHEGKDRINRYVFDEQNNKFAGKRDRKSDIQDNASLYMMPESIKK
jgi:hypothetical protein